MTTCAAPSGVRSIRIVTWPSSAGSRLIVTACPPSGERSTAISALPVWVPAVWLPKSSAWGDFSNVNRLMQVAGLRDDLCGLRIDIVHLAWTGGSTYVHRPVPLYMPNYPPNLGHFNYAITWPNSGAEVIARDQGIELVRLTGAPCIPDPGYNWLLP